MSSVFTPMIPASLTGFSAGSVIEGSVLHAEVIFSSLTRLPWSMTRFFFFILV